MNHYATCFPPPPPIFLFFIKVATSHRSPYAVIWNWKFARKYGGGNCLVEAQMWLNYRAIESSSCLFLFHFYIRQSVSEKHFLCVYLYFAGMHYL